MKDDMGLYYYPFPENKRVRMYVRKEEEEICFRLWNADDSGLWKDHGWVPYDAIKQASAMYKGKNFNPTLAYDIEVAKSLINENQGTSQS